jgi:hypothetical protein
MLARVMLLDDDGGLVMKTRIISSVSDNLRMLWEISVSLVDAFRAVTRGRPRVVKLIEVHDGIVRSQLPGF